MLCEQAAGMLLYAGSCCMACVVVASRLGANAPPCLHSSVLAWLACRAGIPFIALGGLGGLKARKGERSLDTDYPRLATIAQRKGVSCHVLALAWMRHKVMRSSARERVRQVCGASSVLW